MPDAETSSTAARATTTRTARSSLRPRPVRRNDDGPPGATDAYGVLFHPDLIRGTALGQEIRNYTFFSYQTREALHVSQQERQTILECLHQIETELHHSIDKHSRRLITAHIGLLLDYCMRFYERQFTTRTQVNKDILMRFETLLDEYFDNDAPQREGLPAYGTSPTGSSSRPTISAT